MNKIRAFPEFHSNIRGLPEGEYVSECGYSQQYPWKVVSKSPSGKSMVLQAVEVERHPDWKPVIHAGGFAGHCSNQSDQFWQYKGLSDRQMRVRLVKSPYHGSDVMWGHKGVGFIANGAVYFYDYNF